MRLLITGGAGFVGANLARAALTDPQVSDIRVLDDFSTGSRTSLAGCPVDVVEGSILDVSLLDRVMTGRDAVVHLAALPSVPRSVSDPVASHDANATGTLHVLEAARRQGAGHVIVASSSSVYGANPVLPKHEEMCTRPLSPYAASKLATEAYTLAYQASYGLPALALRLFNVYGPGQRHDHAYAAAIPRFIHAAMRGEPVTFFGDGRQTRDFTYVAAVCQVILDALRRSVCHPDPVNLAFGTRTDLHTIVAELERILDRPIEKRLVPARVGDVRHSKADNRQLLKLFPKALPTPLRDGLIATTAWMKQQDVPSKLPGR